jgi:diguanylate cyclase (GGDEF)-like protein/PAS domain S-box-containing protein
MNKAIQESIDESSGDGSVFPVRQLIYAALILAGVTVGAELLNTISWKHGDISIMWPSTGLLVGMLLCVPRRQWAAYIAVGITIDFVATLLPPLSSHLWLTLAATGCNVIEVTVAAWLLRPALAPERYMARAGQLVSLLVYGVIVAPGVASLCYATCLSLGHYKSFWTVFSEWFTGDALGIAIMTPLYLALRARKPFSHRTWYEAAGLFLLLCAVSVGVFWQTSLPLLFVILPVLLLVEMRLGMAGAALGLLAVASIGGFFTARGHGPIGLTVFSLSPRTFMLQVFAFVSMLLLYIAEVVRAARNRFELNLRASEQRFRLLAEGSSDIIALGNLDHEIVYVSPAATTLLGWEPGSAPLINRRLMVHPDDLTSFEKLYSDCLAGKTRNILEFRGRKKDGGYLWMEANLVLHRNPETRAPEGFINVMRDISGRKAADEELNKALNVAENRAITDAVTGIANRRRLDEYVEKEWIRALRGGSTLSVLMIDVDHFKHYNDRYGHLAGDRCLREVTGAIASVAHRPSDFVGRYGGEEFVVVLPDTDTTGARHIAERIRVAVEQEQIPHEGNPHSVVTVSVGCAAIRPTTGQHSSLLLESADAAMYLAKQSGRNCVRVDGDEAPLLWP